MKKRKQFDHDYAVHGFYADAWDRRRKGREILWSDTALHSPYGTANLFHEPGAEGCGTIRFCRGGRMHVRIYRPAPTELGLVRMAAAFMREVVKKRQKVR